jgi:hypothetical protein
MSMFAGLEKMLCLVKHVTVNELNELMDAIVNVNSKSSRS